ncbi:MAG: ATP-dependent chaperone ClpB, partial [Planctomycetes bacterium]|nr:ATP-dependent chaperone ClpB [Planctomycetota bacterium]
MPFRFDKFTIKAQEAVQAAVELAGERGNPQVTALHLLQALLSEREGIVRPLLEKIGVDRGQLERILKAELAHLPKVSGGSQPQPDQELVKVFEAATAASHAMKDEFVSTDHLLLALAKTPSKAK